MGKKEKTIKSKGRQVERSKLKTIDFIKPVLEASVLLALLTMKKAS